MSFWTVFAAVIFGSFVYNFTDRFLMLVIRTVTELHKQKKKERKSEELKLMMRLKQLEEEEEIEAAP